MREWIWETEGWGREIEEKRLSLHLRSPQQRSVWWSPPMTLLPLGSKGWGRRVWAQDLMLGLNCFVHLTERENRVKSENKREQKKIHFADLPHLWFLRPIDIHCCWCCNSLTSHAYHLGTQTTSCSVPGRLLDENCLLHFFLVLKPFNLIFTSCLLH